MRNKPHRIIIDTNLFISFLITKNHTQLTHFIFSKKCVLIFGDELIEEFIEVAKRPKFRRFFSATDIEDLLSILYKQATFIKATSKVDACRDPKDNFLLSLAIDGKADFLLTGDQDLLVLKEFGNTAILTVSEYFKLILLV